MVERRKYALAVRLQLGHEKAKAAAIEALAGEGFGLLSEIDVAATLKKKLGVDFPPYVILGMCNPPLAHQALQEENDLGVMLPCNVVVYAEGEAGSTVAAIDPVVQFSKVQNPKVEPVAREVQSRLLRGLESLEKSYGTASTP